MKRGRDYVRVTTIADKQILVPVRDIVLVLPPTLFGSLEVPGHYEERYEVMYRRDGGLWHGRAEIDALIAAGVKLPTLPPWIALANNLWCYAQTRMAGGEADWLVSVIERQVRAAGGEDAIGLLNRAYQADEAATIQIAGLIFENTARESHSAGRRATEPHS